MTRRIRAQAAAQLSYLIGADEAGYGPNLGPLVVGATLWRVPVGTSAADLWATLTEVICDIAGKETAPKDDWRPELGDSKLLYQPSSGIARLERGLLAMSLCCHHPPALSSCWRELWERFEPAPAEAWRACPCSGEHEAVAPLSSDVNELLATARRVRQGMDRAGVRLEAVRCRSIFPREFNEQCDRLGNKASVLSQATLGLVGELHRSVAGQRVEIVCDKHGGRSRYAALLQHEFPDDLVDVLEESQSLSRYRCGPRDNRAAISFRVGAERLMPVALASMAAKYLRELAMRAINDYWRRRVPNLSPTAGYPGDAKRFREEIAAARESLGIAWRSLWRER